MRKFLVGAILTYAGLGLFLLGFVISTISIPALDNMIMALIPYGHGGSAFGRRDSNPLRHHRRHRPPPMHSISLQTHPSPSHHHTTNPRPNPTPCSHPSENVHANHPTRTEQHVQVLRPLYPTKRILLPKLQQSTKMNVRLKSLSVSASNLALAEKIPHATSLSTRMHCLAL